MTSKDIKDQFSKKKPAPSLLSDSIKAAEDILNDKASEAAFQADMAQVDAACRTLRRIGYGR